MSINKYRFNDSINSINSMLNYIGVDVRSFPRIIVTSLIVFGALLLSYYIVMTSTPLPPIDLSFGFTISVFMIVFSITLFLFSFVFFMPFILIINDHGVISNNFPLYRANTKSHRGKFTPYIVINFPFIFYILSHYYYYKMDMLYSHSFSIKNLLIFSASLIFSGICSYIIGRKNYRKSKLNDIYSFLIKINLKSIFWMYIFLVFFVIYDDSYRNLGSTHDTGAFGYEYHPQKKRVLSDFNAVFLIIFIHFLQSTVYVNFKNVILIILLFLLLFLGHYPGANNITSYVLRLIGAGGGVYAELYVKSFDDGKGKIVLHKGCIMISTSSSIVLKNIEGDDVDSSEGQKKCDNMIVNNYDYQVGDNVIFNRMEIQYIKISKNMQKVKLINLRP